MLLNNFFKTFLHVPHQYLSRNIPKKKKVTVFALEIYWTKFMPVLTLITRVISSVHGTFCGSCIEQFDI